MSKAYYGLKRSIEGIISGFFIVIFLKFVLNYFEVEYLISLFYLISIIGIYLLYKKMKYWSIWYSLGWIFGVILFYQLLDTWELVLFVLIFILTMGFNVKYKIKNFLRRR
jgi:hypothetical protein